MCLSFKTLYFLEGNEITLAEIRRTDLPGETDKSKLYFWFLLKKKTGRISRLEFVSMKSDTGKEERIFNQGKLSFDQFLGKFEDINGELTLKNQPAHELPEMTRKKINTFLRNLR
ncbi:hypothetical protein MNBD_BACTEROID07-58 [hydrothermal vent metagenome]|uniref:Uncharacterized protein n=1 Tax=hydrothermal vent metagenome TaxID=652676 RepID=A0A3B0UVS4_9ZZZZ